MVYMVMRPAIVLVQKVMMLGRDCPNRIWLCANYLGVVYVVRQMAELAPGVVAENNGINGDT